MRQISNDAPELTEARTRIEDLPFASEQAVVETLLGELRLSTKARKRISRRAGDLVRRLRSHASPGLMEQLLVEYGLGTDEGVALMCLAEAFLRTPDAPSLDALISDKIGGRDWARHLGHAESALINASTWALMLTGRVFRRIPAHAEDLGSVMHDVVRRLGEPVARVAITKAITLLSNQFVLGQTIGEALKKAAPAHKAGYVFSFDMLGEAAQGAADAERYFQAYAHAIEAIVKVAADIDPHANPGISVKLSALHPRFEPLQRGRVLAELVPRLAALADQARAGNIGLTVDAEEADVLNLSLDVIAAVLKARDFTGWDGFGIVVQAYAKTGPAVIDWVHALARQHRLKLAVRLVKGAYWDAEIKHAQVLGVETYPVFTRKPASDLSYLVCAQMLFDITGRIYPQFATHNAHTIAAIVELAPDNARYEFQRLHGMGEALHEMTRKGDKIIRRIYAPVGVHRDLLAYLVRRLLENGANSSFVHRMLDKSVAAGTVVRDPVGVLEKHGTFASGKIPLPGDLYGARRRNSRGWNFNQPHSEKELTKAIEDFRHTRWKSAPTIGGPGDARRIVNPAIAADIVGEASDAGLHHVADAFERASAAAADWGGRPVDQRAEILERAADLYEAHSVELMALAVREAGKTRIDAVLEIREAVDFLRYYAAQARRVLGPGKREPLGPVVSISPWNFPLAIFTGQSSAALAAGNPVIAKPAEQTPLIAGLAANLMHQAGVPHDAMIVLPGDGAIGQALTRDPRAHAICFTGSIETAVRIDQTMSTHGDPRSPLIAETGGINCMIVDSTAFLHHAVRDIISSAFQSAGQRCSALRVLFIQEDIAEPILAMLEGALAELTVGDPWQLATDVGPIIDVAARDEILAHIGKFEASGRMMFQVRTGAECAAGTFVAPTVLRLDRLEQLDREVFGPVLHVLTYRSGEIDAVVQRINALGHGLTLGVHSRLDERIDAVCQHARIGNIYVNRNQIGAVVGVQPFGGEGLSGTGPKAGGPHYLTRFTRSIPTSGGATNGRATSGRANDTSANDTRADDTRANVPETAGLLISRLPPGLAEAAAAAAIRAAKLSFEPVTLEGPTGERNTYSLRPRGTVLCLGPKPEAVMAQVMMALGAGNRAVIARDAAPNVADAFVRAAREVGLEDVSAIGGEAATLAGAGDIDAVLFDGQRDVRAVRMALSRRDGARVALLTSDDDPVRLCVERVVCEDTTASGGNASLLADAE